MLWPHQEKSQTEAVIVAGQILLLQTKLAGRGSHCLSVSLERSERTDVERLVSAVHYAAAICDASDLKNSDRLHITAKWIDISKSYNVTIELNVIFSHLNQNMNNNLFSKLML